MVDASKEGTFAYKAIETLLKGVDVELPHGVQFLDKDGNPRTAVRVQWWNDDARKLGEIALPFGVDIGDPAPLTANVACLDYSIAKEGKLVAYRWSGAQSLGTENFAQI